MRKTLPMLLGAALLLFGIGCTSDASGANAIPLEEASVQPGEFFPYLLNDQSAGCSVLAGFPNARPRMVMDQFQQEWFSSHLAAAGEKPLIADIQGPMSDSPSMRFIWLPTFDNPVVVHVTGTPQGERRLVAVRLSGAGGYDPGEVADRLDRLLTPAEWRRIGSVLDRTDLLEQRPDGCELGLDGSEWIVEAIDDHGYHFLKRWSPQDGPMHEFGLLLLELTGWQFEDVY